MESSFREEVRMYMLRHESFTPWSSSHLWAMGVSLLCIIFVPLLAKKYLSASWQHRLGAMIGFSIAGFWITWTILEITAGTWDIRRHLPLQLCRFSNLAIVMVLVWKRQWWYEILYFWALPPCFRQRSRQTCRKNFRTLCISATGLPIRA